MSFALWAVLTVIVAAASAALAVPLARRYDERRASGGALAVLRQQLADLDALPDAEAAPLRLELKRRMLAEGTTDEVVARPMTASARVWVAVGVAAIFAGVSTGLYISLGRPELTGAAAPAAPPADAGQPAADVMQMVGQLEARMKANPGDPEGWRMLGWSYFQTRRFADAAEAYRRASALVPADANYQSAMGEALVQAAEGTVTPAAETAFRAAQQRDPTDARSRYFLALLKDQRGDSKGAIDDWIAILKAAPADAPWAGELRRIISEVGQKAGIEVTSRLPAAPVAQGPASATAPRGPTAADVAAAQQMAPADQQAMIRGMVDGLAARLAQNPKDADGWLRLMRARMVLGDKGAAIAAYGAAKAAFAGDAPTLARLEASAKELGISG